MDASDYQRFVALQDTRERQATLKKWFAQSVAIHGLLSLLCLALIGQLPALVSIPEPMRGISDALRGTGGDPEGEGWESFWSGMRLVLLPALAMGSIAGAVFRTREEAKQRAGGQEADPTDRRGIEALLPRNAQERTWTTLLSLNAGISEEIAFRLLLPLLIWRVVGDAAIALVAATLIFGLAHLYQGWVGVVTTTLVGALLMLVYLLTANLWAAIVLHAVFDLSALALAPWLAERWFRASVSRE